MLPAFLGCSIIADRCGQPDLHCWRGGVGVFTWYMLFCPAKIGATFLTYDFLVIILYFPQYRARRLFFHYDRKLSREYKSPPEWVLIARCEERVPAANTVEPSPCFRWKWVEAEQSHTHRASHIIFGRLFRRRNITALLSDSHSGVAARGLVGRGQDRLSATA